MKQKRDQRFALCILFTFLLIPRATFGSEPLKLTYSQDTEFLNPEVLYSTAVSEYADDFYKRSFQQKTLNQWAAHLKISPTQLKTFMLRKGVPKNQAAYHSYELSYPLFLKNQGFDNRSWNRAKELNLTMLREAHADVKPMTDEAGAIEVSTETTLKNVDELRKEVDILHSFYPQKQFASGYTQYGPSTHLHIGLPANKISEEQAQAIASALEINSVLSLALDPTDERKLTYVSSPLAGVNKRGPVYLKLNAFDEPLPAHDLELRQYSDLDEGFELIEMGSTLAQNRESLCGGFKPYAQRFTHEFDSRFGNLQGVLERVKELLQKSKNVADQKLAERLGPLIDEIPDQHALTTQQTRERVSGFIKKSNMIERVRDPNFYLIESKVAGSIEVAAQVVAKSCVRTVLERSIPTR